MASMEAATATGMVEGNVAVTLKKIATFLAVPVALAVLWEGYKWLWQTTSWAWPFVVNDTTMPHLYSIVQAFSEPTTTGGPPLIHSLLDATWFTGKEALAGFVLGA